MPIRPFSPRTRGCSTTCARIQICLKFSPRTRGCSLNLSETERLRIVFPAYAGMFPGDGTQGAQHPSFPRVRGDVPWCRGRGEWLWWFSPRTRGCSSHKHIKTFKNTVFPAYAGMFPPATRANAPIMGFPRVRGDVPPFDAVCLSAPMFSPRTRGCSLDTFLEAASVLVFPAYAGMFLLFCTA